MIIVENITINGRQFTHTYSDENRYVVRDGVEYDEAYDPIEYNRQYTEGEPIPRYDEDPTADEVLDIIFGGDE